MLVRSIQHLMQQRREGVGTAGANEIGPINCQERPKTPCAFGLTGHGSDAKFRAKTYRRLALRGLISLFMACTVAGCLESEYDISQQILPVYPISSGNYIKGSTRIAVIRWNEGYKFISFDPDQVLYARFYRVPESQRYLVAQLSPEAPADKTYLYVFAKISSDKFETFGFQYKELPSYLQSFVKMGPNGTGAKVIDGPRDTLYVLREICRHGVDLMPIETYHLL
jgi:hypothetical protein